MKSPTIRIAALGFSPDATPLLRQLESAGMVGLIRWPGDDEAPGPWLARHWSGLDALVAVGACGLVVRLVAPLLRSKAVDPAVVVLDPHGRFAVPLLGGHAAGGELLARELAALLGGQAAITGSSRASGRLCLDSFGAAWGWCRSATGDWNALMQAAAQPGPTPALEQTSGLTLWRELEALRQPSLAPSIEAAPKQSAAAADLADPGDLPAGGAALRIDHRLGEGCRWHPPVLWLGLGCERLSSESLLERLVLDTLAEAGLAAEAVAGLASADRKGDEPALLALAQRRGWPLRLFSSAELATVTVPNPSAAVARELGTASVAEASALLASGQGQLLVEKRIGRARADERGAATLAVALSRRQWAPQRGELHLVGSGPGDLALLNGDSRRALEHCAVWVGYGLYLDLLEPLRRPDQLRRDGRLTAERDRCLEALDLAAQGLKVALISSGDSGIYGMAGLALELWLARPAIDRPILSVHPGISALQLAAARVGAPLMHDFCTISLSDRLTPWDVIERRLRAAAAGDFVVALYNPRSVDRHWQLERARSLLLEGRPAGTPVAVARQLGREGERVTLHSLGDLPVEQVDMLTLVLVGNSSTRIEDGRMVTPRGYPGATLS